MRTIEDLKVGELVYSYDLEGKQLVTDVIEETYENTQANLYKLTLDDGSIIQGTYYHPFYNWGEKNWKPLGDFKQGSTLLTIDGNTRTSSRLETIGSHKTYNLSTKKYYNYIIATSKNDKFLVLAVPPDDVYLELIKKNPQIVEPSIMPMYIPGGDVDPIF